MTKKLADDYASIEAFRKKLFDKSPLQQPPESQPERRGITCLECFDTGAERFTSGYCPKGCGHPGITQVHICQRCNDIGWDYDNNILDFVPCPTCSTLANAKPKPIKVSP